ncbi:MAG TPA: SH3 domain-containing protein [Terriglobales bacterium]|nr:SH3 domain-containing protein [Terriglobales bacterium]
MRRAARIALLLTLVACAVAEDAPKTQERDFSYPSAVIETALRQLGAYTGSRLPSLDGFIKTERAQLPHYQRPYYEYKIELAPAPSDHTLVKVKANVSAWYEDPDGHQSGYQTLESNGRLESDLLDRLADYLANNGSKIITDSQELARRIEGVGRQRAEAERRVAELEKQMQGVAAKSQSDPGEYVSAPKASIAILSAPQERASVLLRTQAEDEFEVLEHRGPWLRVQLQDSQSGWVKSALMKSNGATPQASGSAKLQGFTIIREVPSTFSGDWPRLKGKQALYIWARPEGSALNTAGSKLRFAESIFRERYREASHNSQNSAAGIVVIFLDQRGGVAAAALDDIAHWADGTLAQPAFLKKCSLDPPGAFEGASSKSQVVLR